MQDAPEDAVVTTCEHVFCNQCISERLTGGEDSSLCPKCKSRISLASLFTKSALKSSLSGGTLVKEEELSDVKMPSVSLSCTSYSSKIKTALDILHSLPPLEVKSEGGQEIERKPFEKKPVITEKAIVFSQWTRMLDMLEVPLKESRLQYRRLDGTMSVTAREKAVKDFNTLPEVFIDFSGSICRSANLLLLFFSIFGSDMPHYLDHLQIKLGSYILCPLGTTDTKILALLTLGILSQSSFSSKKMGNR